MKQQKLIYCFLAWLFMLGVAQAVQSPIVFLKGVSNQMLNQLEQNKSRLKQPGVVHSIVRNTLVPYVDLDRMSALVVGPNYWRSATVAQRNQFKNEFTRMVISTYSAAISSYDADRILFYPLRNGYSDHMMQVSSVIARRNGQRIAVSYKLIRYKNSWRIYDFSIENVSIVQSYRAQFSSVLSNSGMKRLIQRLMQHNRES